MPQRMGVHGMVLFGGREGLHGSHMPMFHSPHDLQVVVRLRAADAHLDQMLRQALSASSGLWSIAPERFDLNRAEPGHADPLRQFRADVFEGHFERGGVRRKESVAFDVDQVLLFNRLDPAARSAGQRVFQVIGAGRAHFLVKRLDQRPDVDLIGRFDTASATQKAGTIVLDGSSLQPPSDREIRSALGASALPTAQGVNWFYVETGDLT